jgi:hypothetical protein
MNSVPARVNVLLAKEAPKALVIARVRSKLFHFAIWDYEKDLLEEGSWFKGKIYPDFSDVSFDGKHMIYLAFGPSKGVTSWTAVSEAPWVEALMFWPQEDTWFGGGTFLEKNRLWLNRTGNDKMENRGKHTPAKNIDKIYTLQYRGDDGQALPPFRKRMERDGWVLKTYENGDTGYEKAVEGFTLILKRRDQKDAVATYGLISGERENNIPDILGKGVMWADWDNLGRLLVVRGGKVLRYTAEDIGNGEPSYTLDCNFEPPKEEEE